MMNVQGVSKKMVRCLYRQVGILYTENAYLSDTHTNYHTIPYHIGRYSILTYEKWAYGGNLEIIHYKGQNFMFIKILIHIFFWSCVLAVGWLILCNFRKRIFYWFLSPAYEILYCATFDCSQRYRCVNIVQIVQNNNMIWWTAGKL